MKDVSNGVQNPLVNVTRDNINNQLTSVITVDQSFKPPGGPSNGPPIAGLTMIQFDEFRQFQRLTTTGADYSKGAGPVPVSISTTDVCNKLEYRVRDAANGNVLKDWTVIATNVAVGQRIITPSIAARLGWNYLDLRANNDDNQIVLGAKRFGVGRGIGGGGQSQLVRMLGLMDPATQTLTQVGITPPEFGSVYARYVDPSRQMASPVWERPAVGGNFDGSGISQLLNLQIDKYGVNCFFVGYAHGGTQINVDWGTGSAKRQALLDILDAVGGFEHFHWHLGGTDAGNGTSYASFKSGMDSLLADVYAHNALLGTNFMSLLCAAGTRVNTNVVTNVQNVRKAMRDSALGIAGGKGAYIEPHDYNVGDGIHETTGGGVQLGTAIHRGIVQQAAGKPLGPVIASAARATDSLSVVLTVTLNDDATALVLTGTPTSKFDVYPSGTTPTIAQTSMIPVSNVAVSGNTITLTLDNTSGLVTNSQALDVYWLWHPDPANTASNDMIRDNYNGDGVAYGRQLIATTASPIAVAAPGGGAQVAPSITSQASIVGTPQEGVALTGNDGVASGSPTATVKSRNWYYADAPSTSIATTQSFTPPNGSATKQLIYEAIWSNGVNPDAITRSVTSAAIQAAAAGWNLVASDDFTDTNGTLLSAHNAGLAWSVTAGAFTLDSGSAYPSTAPAVAGIQYTPGSAKQAVEADIIVTTKVNQRFFVIGRITVQSPATYYLFGVDFNSNLMYLGRYVNNTYADLITPAAKNLTAGQTYKFRLEMEGTQITGFIDGVQVMTFNDTSGGIAGPGKAGFRVVTGASSTVAGSRATNIKVYEKAS